MRLRRTSSAVAIAALGGLAVLGTAATADAAASATPAAKGACTIASSFTGLDGHKLTPGGAAVDATVSFTNTSQASVPKAVEALEFGRSSANGPTKSLLVEVKTDKGYVPLHYTTSLDTIVLRSGSTLKAGAKESYQLRVSAPKGTAVGNDYLGLAFSGAVTPGAPVPAHPNTTAQDGVVPSGTSCHSGISTSIVNFAVVKGGTATPTAEPTASASASATTAPGTDAPTAASASSSVPALATTGGGSDSGTIAGAAGALLLVGGAAVVVTRRRRAGAHS